MDVEKINHPRHYMAQNIECINVVEAFGLNFCLGNAIKYILRCGKKDDKIEDLKKAAWYIHREIESTLIQNHPDENIPA